MQLQENNIITYYMSYKPTSLLGLCRNSNGTQKIIGHKTGILNQTDCENECNSQNNCTAVSYNDKNKMCIFYDANGKQIVKGDGDSSYSCLYNENRNTADGMKCSQDLSCVSRNCVDGICETSGSVAPIKSIQTVEPKPVSNESTKLKKLVNSCNSMLSDTEKNMNDYKIQLNELKQKYNNMSTKSGQEILNYKDQISNLENEINKMTLVLNKFKEDEKKLKLLKQDLINKMKVGQTNSRMVQITQDVNIYKNKIIYVLIGLILLFCVFIIIAYKNI